MYLYGTSTCIRIHVLVQYTIVNTFMGTTDTGEWNGCSKTSGEHSQGEIHKQKFWDKYLGAVQKCAGCKNLLSLCLSGPSRWRPPQVAPVARQGGGARLAARTA
eukprot:COSAG05_NODE_4358_length_1550_cov_26.463818_2_plen_103_part_01